MKTFKIFIILFLIFFQNIYAQKQNITHVKFDEDKIILNNKLAYNYKRIENNFSIFDLKNVEIISGEIFPLGEGKFFSKITFIAQNKLFKSTKIIGRNPLIFRLSENNVINKDFTINDDKLNKFIKIYNEE